jgi:hypothetical protein
VLVVLSFGCAKIEQPEIFQVLDVQILEPSRDETIRVLLRPLYGYSNSTNEIVVVEENWMINGVSVQIREFDTLIPTGGLFKEEWDHFSLQHFLPLDTKEIIISGSFTAWYPSGPITATLEEKKFPITW